MKSDVVILGVFVADTAYLAPHLPVIGQTVKSSAFTLGPGGKGSNQAVAAAMAGANTTFISKIGRDAFGEIALRTYEKAGVHTRIVQMADVPTGAAFIFVSTENGDNLSRSGQNHYRPMTWKTLATPSKAHAYLSRSSNSPSRGQREPCRSLTTPVWRPYSILRRLKPFPIQSTPLRLYRSERNRGGCAGRLRAFVP
ncbi:PfkB family carbohydrate kinase [Mesorhizobium sp.]|uniref:PfkB family carbohydrate kinase n=1 Tax=Mesorhizobium sp. TaxID=1871066 RepID=UPI00345BF8D1